MSTTLGPFLSVEGEINSEGSVTLGGVLRGTLRAAGRVVLLPTADVEGDIEAEEVVVGGRVQGRVTATGLVEVTRTANVIGDIRARRVIMTEAWVEDQPGRALAPGAHRPHSDVPSASGSRGRVGMRERSATFGDSEFDRAGTSSALPPDASCVGQGVMIRGMIDGKGDLAVSGRIDGNVRVDGDIRIEEGARVDGAMFGRRVVLHGTIFGEVHAETRLELGQGARVRGDISSASLTIAEGARYAGKAEVGEPWTDAQPIEAEIVSDVEARVELDDAILALRSDRLVAHVVSEMRVEDRLEDRLDDRQKDRVEDRVETPSLVPSGTPWPRTSNRKRILVRRRS